MGVDSTFLRKEDKLFDLNVKCAFCGNRIELFVNSISSAGEAWPFCQTCATYVDVVPGT